VTLFLSGALVGAIALLVLVGVAVRRYPTQYDDLIEFVRK
jgi:hypothetical protein